MKPERGFEALRRHRWSTWGASYFLTLCEAARTPQLNAPETANAIQGEIDAIETDGHWRLRAGVLMPDHIHLLVTLVGQLPLGRVVARLKAKTKPALVRAHLRWQGNYYEHRLRDSDRIEEVVRYIFLNPYRAGLRTAEGTYPLFRLGLEEAGWFTPSLNEGRPFPEWLQ